MKRSAGQAKTLSGKYYASDEIYDLESARIFNKRWLYVGRQAEIPHPGDFFLYDQDMDSIIVLRDGKEVRAFHNICRHRGTRLCSESQGCFSKSIQCPYHAWTYSLAGALIGAPNMHEVPGFSRDEFPLHPVQTAVWEGCIFINLSEGPEPFAQSFAPVMGRFTPWQLSELTTAHRLTYEVKANWKLILQNYSECYHCPNLHPLLNRLTPYRSSSNDIEEGAFLGGPMLFSEGCDSMTLSGNACAPPLAGLEEQDLRRVYYYVIFPNMLLSLHPDYVLVHRIQRLAVDRSSVKCDWLFHPTAVSQDGFDPSDAVAFWNMTNQQDWHICELSQQGLRSSAYRPGPYAELESMIAALDREYLRALSGD